MLGRGCAPVGKSSLMYAVASKSFRSNTSGSGSAVTAFVCVGDTGASLAGWTIPGSLVLS